MIKKFIILGLFIISSISHADAITLESKTDITRTYELSTAIGSASSKVMACIDKPGGSPETCACFDKKSCPFQSDFEKVANLFCKLKSDYPKWQGSTINYTAESSKESRALGMVGLELQFGKFCK